MGRPNGGGLEDRFPGATLQKTRAKPRERKVCDLENGDYSLEGREGATVRVVGRGSQAEDFPGSKLRVSF